jgi:general secretion pathway protein G
MAIRSKNSAGFSLIELLVGIAIIGILSAIAIPAYMAYREKAKIAQAYAELKDIQLAIGLLAIDTNRWPGPNPVGVTANLEAWDLNALNAGLFVANPVDFPNWRGPYIKSGVPQDPWGSDYFFDPDYNINGTNFVVVGSFGPNRVGRNVYDSDDVVLVLPAG